MAEVVHACIIPDIQTRVHLQQPERIGGLNVLDFVTAHISALNVAC